MGAGSAHGCQVCTHSSGSSVDSHTEHIYIYIRPHFKKHAVYSWRSPFLALVYATRDEPLRRNPINLLNFEDHCKRGCDFFWPFFCCFWPFFFVGPLLPFFLRPKARGGDPRAGAGIPTRIYTSVHLQLLCIYIYIYIQVYISTNIYLFTNFPLYLFTHIHIYIYTYIHIYIYTYIHIYIYTYIHTYIYTYIHIYIYTYIHIYIYIYIHIHVYTYIHIYV